MHSVINLRQQTKLQQITGNFAQLRLEVLPPISAAAKYHSFTVYLQIQQWKGSNTMRITDWGWEMSGGHLLPILTAQQAAPDGLLQVFTVDAMVIAVMYVAHAGKTIWNVHLPAPSVVERHAAIVLLFSLKLNEMMVF